MSREHYKRTMPLFELESENIVAAGGPMHRMNTDIYTEWTKLFGSVQAAKDAAQEDYDSRSQSGKRLTWIKHRNGSLSSQDLGFVMYHIKERKLDG